MAHRPLAPVLIAAALAAALLAVGVAVSFLPPTNWTWGIDLVRWYPAWARVAWLVLGVAGLAWAVRGTGWRPAPGPVGRWPAAVLGVVAGAAAGAVFHLARARTGLLGDGYQIVVDLRQGHPPTARSALYNVLEPALVRWQRPGGVPTLTEAGLLSTLVGALVVAFVVTRLVERARRGDRPAASTGAIAAILLTGAWWQLFFGYVECYALLGAAMVLFLVGALDRIEGRGTMAVPFVALIVAVASHPFGLGLAPALLVLAATGPVEGRARRVATWAGALVALAGLGWLAATAWPKGADGRSPVEYLSPFKVLRQVGFVLMERTGRKYDLGLDSVFTPRQAADVANHLALVAWPALAVLAGLACHPRGRRALVSPAARVALAAAIPYVLARAGMRTIIGPMRDWDLYAGAGIALAGWAAFAAAHWVEATAADPTDDGATGRRLAWTAGVAGLLFLVPWVGVQADAGRAVARHLALADAKPKLEPSVEATFHGAMGLRLLSLGQAALAGSAFERAWSFNHSWSYAWRAGLAYLSIGQAEKAAAAFTEVIKAQPDDPRAYVELGSAWNALERYDRAEPTLRRAIAMDGGAAAPRIHLARTLGMLGRESEARRILEDARPRLAPGDPLAGEFALLDANLPPLYPAPRPADGTHRRE